MSLTIGIVVNQIEAVTVVNSAEMGLGQSQADSIRDTLAKRTRSDLNA